MARTNSCRTTSRSVKYTVAMPGTFFNACNASTTPERFTSLHGGPGQNNARDLLLLEGRNRHGHGEVSFSRASRSDSKNNIVLLNCLDVRPLIRASRYNRWFARRGGDFR